MVFSVRSKNQQSAQAAQIWDNVVGDQVSTPPESPTTPESTPEHKPANDELAHEAINDDVAAWGDKEFWQTGDDDAANTVTNSLSSATELPEPAISADSQTNADTVSDWGWQESQTDQTSSTTSATDDWGWGDAPEPPQQEATPPVNTTFDDWDNETQDTAEEADVGSDQEAFFGWPQDDERDTEASYHEQESWERSTDHTPPEQPDTTSAPDWDWGDGAEQETAPATEQSAPVTRPTEDDNAPTSEDWDWGTNTDDALPEQPDTTSASDWGWGDETEQDTAPQTTVIPHPQSKKTIEITDSQFPWDSDSDHDTSTSEPEPTASWKDDNDFLATISTPEEETADRTIPWKPIVIILVTLAVLASVTTGAVYGVHVWKIKQANEQACQTLQTTMSDYQQVIDEAGLLGLKVKPRQVGCVNAAADRTSIQELEHAIRKQQRANQPALKQAISTWQAQVKAALTQYPDDTTLQALAKQTPKTAKDVDGLTRQTKQAIALAAKQAQEAAKKAAEQRAQEEAKKAEEEAKRQAEEAQRAQEEAQRAQKQAQQQQPAAPRQQYVAPKQTTPRQQYVAPRPAPQPTTPAPSGNADVEF